MTFRPSAALLHAAAAAVVLAIGCDAKGPRLPVSPGAAPLRTTDGATSDSGTAAEAAASTAPLATSAAASTSAATSAAPTGTPSTTNGSAAPAGTQDAAVAVPRPGADGVSDVTFDHLKFNIEKGQKFDWKMLTPGVEGLKGKRIRIRGWMLPQSVLQNTNIKEFVFVRDNQECCFGPGAALYDCMRVEMAADQSADFKVTPITIEGTLVFDPLEFAEMTLALFLLKDAAVR